MREIGFMIIAGFVSGVASRFFPPTPGIENLITIIGTVSAVAGGAVGVLFKKLTMWPLIGVILFALALSILGLVQFNSVARGEPGAETAMWLYIWSAVIFLPVGMLIEITGLKLSD